MVMHAIYISVVLSAESEYLSKNCDDDVLRILRVLELERLKLLNLVAAKQLVARPAHMQHL